MGADRAGQYIGELLLPNNYSHCTRRRQLLLKLEREREKKRRSEMEKGEVTAGQVSKIKDLTR